MTKFRLINILFILFLTFVLIVYLMFFSSAVANNTGIIKIRNWYFNNSYDAYGRFLISVDNSSLLNSPIRVYSKTRNGTYYYGFIGNFESVDVGSNTVYFKTNDENIYGFEFKSVSSSDEKDVLATKGIDPSGGIYRYSFNENTPKESYLVAWEDFRTLNELILEHKKQPSLAINKNVIMYLMKFNK